MLGDMYRFGQGVTENSEEAVKHYKNGAEQGVLGKDQNQRLECLLQ